MNSRAWLTGALLLSAAGVGLGGCASARTTPATIADRLEARGVEIGSSATTVVDAIGKPHLRLVRPGDAPDTERWLYTESSRHETGTITVGRYETFYDPEGRLYSHFIMPVDVPVHETQVRVVALLTFEAGKLVAIDLPKAGERS